MFISVGVYLFAAAEISVFELSAPWRYVYCNVYDEKKQMTI